MRLFHVHALNIRKLNTGKDPTAEFIVAYDENTRELHWWDAHNDEFLQTSIIDELPAVDFIRGHLSGEFVMRDGDSSDVAIAELAMPFNLTEKGKVMPDVDAGDATRARKVLETFGAAWADGMLATELATKLTCTEANALVALLRNAGYPDAADQWAEEHAADDEFDDEHYAGE